MNDSADMKTAADRLQSALADLEGQLVPLLKKVNQLETLAKTAESFKADRAHMAVQLDESQSREQALTAQKEQFTQLAEETRQELDGAISQIKSILDQD